MLASPAPWDAARGTGWLCHCGFRAQCQPSFSAVLFDFSFGEQMGTNHLLQGREVGPGGRATVLKAALQVTVAKGFLFCLV